MEAPWPKKSPLPDPTQTSSFVTVNVKGENHGINQRISMNKQVRAMETVHLQEYIGRVFN